MGKAADETLRLKVKAMEQEIDHNAGKKILEDHVDAFDMLEKQSKRSSRHVLESDVPFGAGTTTVKSKSGPTCFVATATYGDIDHPHVLFLRKYRDQCLTKTSVGRTFIDWYWGTGPKLAALVLKHRTLKLFSKTSLAGLIFIIKKAWKPKAS